MKVPPSKQPKAKKTKKPPLKVVVDREQRMVLEEIARTMTYPFRDVIRARTILLLAYGVSQVEVARRVGLRRRIVRKWAERFVVAHAQQVQIQQLLLAWWKIEGTDHLIGDGPLDSLGAAIGDVRTLRGGGWSPTDTRRVGGLAPCCSRR